MPSAQRRAALVRALAEPEAPDSHVEAMDRQTDAIRALVAEIAQARTDFKPAADALFSLGDAQARLCAFLVKNRLKLVGGGLALLVTLGAISPNLATAIAGALKTAGLA